jgi:hypothetical protein
MKCLDDFPEQEVVRKLLNLASELTELDLMFTTKDKNDFGIDNHGVLWIVSGWEAMVHCKRDDIPRTAYLPGELGYISPDVLAFEMNGGIFDITSDSESDSCEYHEF